MFQIAASAILPANGPFIPVDALAPILVVSRLAGVAAVVLFPADPPSM
jgi:hypothetical protein